MAGDGQVGPPDALREPVLVAQDLGKRFRLYASPGARLAGLLTGGRWGRCHEHTALAGVSFAVRPGETFGIMGRNGAGKTTLLGLLAGHLAPSCGSIRRPLRVGSLIALGAGFDPESCGRDNVRQWGALHADGAFTPAELEWITSFTELGEALDRPVKTYSQGMQLRLGFAVATARRPDLLVIDEVMAVGDFFFRRKCHERIRAFVEAGTAAILVSHDYTEIVQFCRRALVLERGEARFLGDAATAVNRYLHSLHADPASVVRADSSALTGAGEADAIPWPEPGQQVRVDTHPEWSAPLARLTSLACCDGSGSQRWVYSQGETMSVFVEFTAVADLRIPTVSVMIGDERGCLIHGSSSHMERGEPLPALPRGGRVRIRYDVALLLRYGEYQVDVALCDLDQEAFADRAGLSFEDLGARTRLLARCERAGVLAVVPRQGGSPTQLTHHGLADLPGRMDIAVLAADAEPIP